jgi:hypothetical protein
MRMRLFVAIASLISIGLLLLWNGDVRAPLAAHLFMAPDSYANPYYGGSGPPSESPTEARGLVTGLVLDEFGRPLSAIPVCLIPIQGACEYERKDWTNKDGTFKMRVEPGEYYVQVQADSAPTSNYPFLPTYYQGTDDRSRADIVSVQQGGTIELHQIVLRSVPLTSISVHIVWSDGTPVRQSNLLFHNPIFPHQGVIGDVAPEVLDGEGGMPLATGYSYYARAVTHCDAGTTIDNRESRPIQEIRVEQGSPSDLTFVIHGPPGEHWHPK